MSNTENREAGAFWFEIQGDRRFVCFDTLDGRTLAVEVTDASFGGEIEVADETGAAP